VVTTRSTGAPGVTTIDSAPVFQKTLWSVTWPLLLSLACSFSLHFVDAFFLARVSDTAAAAAGALFPVLGATLVVFSAVGQAGASVAAQLLGARREPEVPVTYLALVLWNLALGVLTSAAFWLLRDLLPAWLGLEGEIGQHASRYLSIIGSFQFLKAAQIAYGNILTSRGETRWSAAEAVLTNVVNVALNLMFLHGVGVPRLGVAGVAWATAAALFVGLVFTMCVVHWHLGVRFPKPSGVVFIQRLRQVLRIGLPSALEPVTYQAMQTLLNLVIVGWGERALAARAYVFSFVMVTTILWGLAFGIGTQIVIAHLVGAERFEDAQRQMRQSLLAAVLGNLLLSLLLALAHRPLLAMLTDDVGVRAEAAPLFWLGMLVEPARAVNIVAGGALRSSGDARYVSFVGLSMMWVVGLPACYVLGQVMGLGLSGIWLGFAVDELSRGIVNYRRWQSGRWQAHRVVVAKLS
jgi:putative MATE family efflux protein